MTVSEVEWERNQIQNELECLGLFEAHQHSMKTHRCCALSSLLLSPLPCLCRRFGSVHFIALLPLTCAASHRNDSCPKSFLQEIKSALPSFFAFSVFLFVCLSVLCAWLYSTASVSLLCGGLSLSFSLSLTSHLCLALLPLFRYSAFFQFICIHSFSLYIPSRVERI